MSAILLIKKCMFWNIGNGQNVYIQGDKWIPVPSSFFIQCLINTLTREVKVSELIVHGRWNASLIKLIFNPQEAQQICNLPLSTFGLKDKLSWRPTCDGNFSVEFAYLLKMERQRNLLGESSCKQGEEFMWKAIWNLKILGLVKHFIWKACLHLVPTKVNLAKRKIEEDTACPLCGATETPIHILWACPATCDVQGEGDNLLRK